MSGYIPGQGRKKPLNNLEAPVKPDIRKGPPRFVWTRKYWKVDTGRTQAQVEHTPLQDAAILYQSRDYNKQHAYGKHASYNVFVNQEFRPPLIERDDILPLSRLPRPVVTDARINPGTAFSSGNNAFADQQNMIQGIEKFITNRVKEGQIRPTFFSPIDMPLDNSNLPDLSQKLPSTSASANFNFPTMDADPGNRDLILPYKQLHTSATAGISPIRLDSHNSQRDLELSYTNPQVSVSSGGNNLYTISSIEGFTPIELDYVSPQISAIATPNYRDLTKKNNIEFELREKGPQVSASSGFTTLPESDVTPIEYDLETKIAGTQPAFAYTKGASTFDDKSAKISVRGSEEKMGKRLDTYSYSVPNNSGLKTDLRNIPEFRKKVASLEGYTPSIPQSSIPRAGISTPSHKTKVRKDN